MNMPPMNADAARMNSIGSDNQQLGQALQQVQNRDMQNAVTQGVQMVAQNDRVMDELSSAASSEDIQRQQFADDFAIATKERLKLATTGNVHGQKMTQMDPQVLRALIQ